jgi:hypothetical protein
MDIKTDIINNIIVAADCWLRDVLRNDRVLNDIEQNLFDAIMAYNKMSKELDPSHLPPPPPLPSDFENQIPTKRYSDRPTIPSPAKGIKSVKESDGDIF